MRISSVLFALFLTMIVLSGCGAIETIFRPGVVWAFFATSLSIFVIILILNRAKR